MYSRGICENSNPKPKTWNKTSFTSILKIVYYIQLVSHNQNPKLKNKYLQNTEK